MRWKHAAGGRISGSATVVGNVVYYANLGTKTTTGLDDATGKQVFSFKDGAFTPVIADYHAIYLIGYGEIYQMLPAKAKPKPTPKPHKAKPKTKRPSKAKPKHAHRAASKPKRASKSPGRHAHRHASRHPSTHHQRHRSSSHGRSSAHQRSRNPYGRSGKHRK